MDPAVVIVAAMGLVATLLATVIGAYSQQRSARSSQIRAAKIEIYAACAENLYEYERLQYNRTKTRIKPDGSNDREELRQEIYRYKSEALASIGRAAIVSENRDLPRQLQDIPREIDDLAGAVDHDDLKRRHQKIRSAMTAIWETAHLEVQR